MRRTFIPPCTSPDRVSLFEQLPTVLRNFPSFNSIMAEESVLLFFVSRPEAVGFFRFLDILGGCVLLLGPPSPPQTFSCDVVIIASLLAKGGLLAFRPFTF